MSSAIPLFGGRDTAVVGYQSKLTTNGRLQAISVEILALDFRSLERFIADQLDRKLAFVILGQVSERAKQQPGAEKPSSFQLFQPNPVVAEPRPLGLLPVPHHD